MKEYEVWQKAGRHGFYGPKYKEERMGTFLQVMMGFESQGAIGAYKERVYNVLLTDGGDVRTIEVQYSFLKPKLKGE